MEEAPTFSQEDTNKVFPHIPKATSRTWALQGLYGWISENKDNRGVSRKYGLSNLYQIGIVEHLSKLDISTDIIKSIMGELGNNPPMDKIILIVKQPRASRIIQIIASPPAYQKELEIKHHKELKNKHHKAFYDWAHVIIDLDKVSFVLSQYKESKVAITIIIDLAVIKSFIDQIIEMKDF